MLGAEGHDCPGSSRLGCHGQKGTSVGRAVHLLAVRHHLAILDLLHDGTYLAAAYHTYRGRTRTKSSHTTHQPSSHPKGCPTAPLLGPQSPSHEESRAGSYPPRWAGKPPRGVLRGQTARIVGDRLAQGGRRTLGSMLGRSSSRNDLSRKQKGSQKLGNHTGVHGKE